MIVYCRAVLRPEGIACTLPAGHDRYTSQDGKWSTDHVNKVGRWSDGRPSREGIPEWGFDNPVGRKLEDEGVAAAADAQPEQPNRQQIVTRLRDWLHETPLSRCTSSSDECDTWPLAYEVADRVLGPSPAVLPQPSKCIGNDPTCPCQDGDVCHYVDDPVSDTKAWPVGPQPAEPPTWACHFNPPCPMLPGPSPAVLPEKGQQ